MKNLELNLNLSCANKFLQIFGIYLLHIYFLAFFNVFGFTYSYQ